jgi:hypothetical protein
VATNIVGCRNDEIEIGMPVEVVFDDVTDDITLLRFKPSNNGKWDRREQKRENQGTRKSAYRSPSFVLIKRGNWFVP